MEDHTGTRFPCARSSTVWRRTGGTGVEERVLFPGGSVPTVSSDEDTTRPALASSGGMLADVGRQQRWCSVA